MLLILLGLYIYCCVILCVLMWLVVMHGKYSYSCVIFLFCDMFYCTTNLCCDYYFWQFMLKHLNRKNNLAIILLN